MPRDMICVYRAADVAEADIVAAWLEEQGITVHVKDRHATSQAPLTVAPRGIEVCVVDSAQADRAKELLREHADELALKKMSEADGPDIQTVCEECGKTSRFPFAQRGRVQTCPNCGRYLDVPEASEGNGS